MNKHAPGEAIGMATVLVTGAGGASGVGAITSLRERTDHAVVGVDMDPTAAGLQLADDGAVVPPASDDAWGDELRDVVERFDVDVLLPTVDEELSRLPSLRSVLPTDARLVAPRQEAIEVALDKYATVRRLRQTDVAVPETWLGTEVEAVSPSAFPLIVKPRRGRGSRGVERVDTESELRSSLAGADRDPTELLVQRFVGGREFTTSVVVTAADRLLSVVPKEAMSKDGSTVVGATRAAPAVRASARAVHEALSPGGPMNVQHRLDGDGTPHLIEVNPRFSSTSCLTAAAGVDEFDLLVRDALGETVDAASSYAHDEYILRYDGHVFAAAEDVDRFR